jgi:hypothetical protein
MSRCHPTLQWLCPLSPWIGQRCPQIIAPLLPMCPLQAPSAGSRLAMAGSLVWGNKTRHIKKQRERGAVGLWWPPFSQKKQPTNGGNDGREMERERGWGGAYGGVLSLRAGQQIEQHKKNKNKIHCGLRWPCYNISHATTNQKHVGVTKETWGKRSDHRVDAWGALFHCFGCN